VFVDELVLTVSSGAGGDGCSAFRHEKYVPMGGPAGGDGGRGGDVVLVADPQRTTFGDVESGRLVRADAGGPGKGSNRTGANAKDRVLRVPVGTTVTDADTGERLVDLARPGDRWVAARGGRGGRGNSSFATATDQAPTRTTPGEPGERRRLRLELRLVADVGLLGLPNAGKSTFLSRVSRATPKIGAYPFTTLAPSLGVVDRVDARRFVIADLPGLVEGAHEGKGLGDRFLRHVERTRVLLHLVDLFPDSGPSPAEAYRTVRRELTAYGHGLPRRPTVVAGTKADLGDGAAAAKALSKAIRRPVLPVSAATGKGLREVLAAVSRAVARAQAGS
jgi:GTP-binding protein